MFPSITFVISLVFLGYISFSIYELVKMYYPPQCSNNPRCVDYYLTQRPKLQLCIFTSSERFLDGLKDESHLKTLSDFNYSVPFEIDLEVNIPKKTRQNGTLYLHLFLLPNAYKIKLWEDAMGKLEHVYNSIPLTGYQIRSKEFELLKGGDKVDHDEVPITHLKKQIGFNILTGVDSFFRDDVPLEFIPYIKFRANRILPIMHHDFLNDRLDNLEVLSSENKTANFKLTYSPVNIGKMRLMLQMELSLKSVKKYGFSDKDIDQMKSLFGDTNIYLLSVTLFVASVHLLFDFLSIKNDVYFWRGKKSMVGLSLRNILWRAFSQIIIFFYLLDEETSVLVVAPAGISALIEIWKVQKVLPIDWRRLKLKNVVLSAEEKRTRDLDGQGMKYLSYILYPLCVVGALYSLLYLQHKSWYSWMIHNLVNGVYAFGFLFMLPQLFINYKLKSVAHLPWRVFMYKAFNTVIDDLFAFIITMPTAHRLACFRDDIVFFIYLYQRWLYPVDKTRVEGPVKED